jgi:hypothetical protein
MKKLLRFLLFGSLLFTLVFGYSLLYRSTANEVVITVTGKDRVKNDDTERYLIYTTGEVYENADSWTFFKFNSADFQGKLIAGKTYKVKVAGWRIPLTNSFKNIVDIEN